MNTMEYKGFKAQIMEAERLRGDHVHGLPPGTALPVYHMDEFLKPPENWMKGPGVFVVPVRPDKGLWFDWRKNSELNTCVLPTVKGCNPITGLQTSGFHLEKYENKCPKHNCDFMADRFCPECNFKWPDRNYCSMHPLWWDGFRADDGTVRQFFFTEEMMRDVATHLIGRENTVPAFGFAFYTPKEMRQEPERVSRGFNNSIITLDYYAGSAADFNEDGSWITATNSSDKMFHYNNSLATDKGLIGGMSSGSIGETTPTSSIYLCNSGDNGVKSFSADKLEIKSAGKIGIGASSPEKKPKVVKNFIRSHHAIRKKNVEVSVGAGAKIRQALNKDPYPLDSWKDKPDAVMTIYFVFQEKFEELKANGMRDLTGSKEGMLENIPTG